MNPPLLRFENQEYLVNELFPSKSNVVFTESSYFKRFGSSTTLPSPDEVRKTAAVVAHPKPLPFTTPKPVVFAEKGLLVKFGSEVTIAEGQCLVAIRKLLPSLVPVPEVFGWMEEGRQSFIYMELIDGVTIEESWNNLAEEDRISICGQLRRMVGAWRAFEQNPAQSFIVEGHIGHQQLWDVVFRSHGAQRAGPFKSVPEFHDWFTTAYGRNWGLGPDMTGGKPPHPYRKCFPDDARIVFTHADLHPRNILISRGKQPTVVAVIDWTQAGWYPDYWEYCKARWTAEVGGEWVSKYVPLFLDESFYDYWDYFVTCRGM